MRTTQRAAKWIAAVAVVAIVGALLGWYYFLRTNETKTATLDAARGLQSAAPAFTGSTGSTNENIALSMQPQASSTAQAATSTRSRGALWEVSSTPVSGASFTSSSTLLFVARPTGYVFSADPVSRAVQRLTDTLRPKVYRAFFGLPGDIIEQTIGPDKGVITFAGMVGTTTASTTDSSLTGIDLSGDVRAIAVDPATGKILYAEAAQGGGVSVLSSTWNGSGQQQLFTSPLAQWDLWWLADGRIVISQKAADNVSGYAYEVGKKGALTPIASGQGLTILPRASSTALLVGTSTNGTLSLSVQASAKSGLTPLTIATIADKCVWAPGASLIAYCAVPQSIPSSTFIDDWYRGAVHTSDSWYQVNALTGSSTPLSAGGDTSLDVEDPVIDPTGSYIAFTNRVDDTLWVLALPH